MNNDNKTVELREAFGPDTIEQYMRDQVREKLEKIIEETETDMHCTVWVLDERMRDGPAIAVERAQALIVLVEAFTIFHRKKLADSALAGRLPTMFGFKEFVEAGGLISYGANRLLLFKRAASYVDKILKGVRPGDLPVEEPTIFELYINGKTASALGVVIPPSLIVRADVVLE